MLRGRLRAERQWRMLSGEPSDVERRLLSRRAGRRRACQQPVPAFGDSDGIDSLWRTMLRARLYPDRQRRLLPGGPGDRDRRLLPGGREGRRARDLHAGCDALADALAHADDRRADDPGMPSRPDRGRRRMRERPQSAALCARLRRLGRRFLLSGGSGGARWSNLQGADERPDVPRCPDDPERADEDVRRRRAPRRARQLSRTVSPGLPGWRDARFDGPLRWRGASLAAEDPGDATERAEPSSRRRQAPATRRRAPAEGVAASWAACRRAADQGLRASAAHSAAAAPAAPCRATDAAGETLRRNPLLIEVD